MTRYTVHVTRTTHLSIEVDADDPAEADVAASELFDEAEEIDSSDTIEFIKDEQTKRLYRWNHPAGWQPLKD